MSTALELNAGTLRNVKAQAFVNGIGLMLAGADTAAGARSLTWGTGAPNHTAVQGSVYVRLDAADSDLVLYRATDGAGTWETIVGSELTDLLAAANAWTGNQTHSGTETFSNAAGVTTDTITERSAGVGVTADGVILKDTTVDVNGTADAIILDADGDTTISAPTDDQIDVEINGADDFVFVANVFRALAGSSVETDTINETTAGSGVTIDGVLVKDGGATLTGNLVVGGKIVATGTSALVDAEHVDLRSNYLIQNVDYVTAAAVTGGRVVNYLPTATADTTAGAGVVTAGVDGVSDPTITTAGAATFAATDLVMISGSANDGENDGLFEVASHAANVLTLKSTSSGITNRVEAFTIDQLVANAGDVGMAITKVTVSVDRVGTDGRVEHGSGSQTGIVFADFVKVGDDAVVNTIDVNGIADAVILDADGDTTISAPTDDQIDFEIAGADDFVMVANIFRALAGSSVETDTINETSAGVGVTIDGAKILDAHIVDSVGFYDTAAPTKIVRMDAGAVTAGNTRVLAMPDADVTITSFAASILDDVDEATFKATVNLEIGTDVQAYDAGLLSLAGLGSAADKGIYSTGVDTWAEFALTAAGRAILDDASADAQRTTLGVGTGDSPAFVGATYSGAVTVADGGSLALRGSGTGTGDVVEQVGSTATEAFRLVVYDQIVSPAAVETNLINLPAGSMIVSVQANVQTALTGGGTTATWSIGVAADPDKYGSAGFSSITGAAAADSLAQNSKSTWFGDNLHGLTLSSASEQLVLTGAATGGATDGDTALTVGSVRVRVIYWQLQALDNA